MTDLTGRLAEAEGGKQGKRLCCHLQCTNQAEAEIWSQSGDTDTCASHLYDMLEDGENRVYVIA